MRSARGWVIAGLISVAIAAAAFLVQPHQDSPEHSSTSDAANGTSAARLFAQAMGHPTPEPSGRFEPANRRVACGGLPIAATTSGAKVAS